LHTKNQLPRLPGTALNVMTLWWCGVVVVVVVFLTDNNNTPTKLVLSCFGLLVGLWQYRLTQINVYKNYMI
jgi:steroid 5-alpha reductase family enzyme